ncbi:BRO1-like domain-containing protein [Dichotomocladium elegans]|nr:BRO1-like domain-containing protein [Dichotomocladium elegans]
MRTTPTADMSNASLQTLMNLMLAQAQECIWQRAAMDQLRDGTIARLSIKIAEFYDVAYETATHSSTQNVFPKAWLIHIQIKALHFNAAAQFRKSCECISQNKYGEEIARLQVASNLVKSAFDIHRSFSGSPAVSGAVINDLQSLQQIIQSNLARAVKDNDMIYLETIPSSTSLPAIQKTGMVEPAPPCEILDPVSIMLTNERRADGSPHPVIGLPLFQKLVPFAVHQAASVYVDRKERVLKEDIITHLEELNAVYHSSVQSLNLSVTLAGFEQCVGLPSHLRAQAAEVREEGGSQALFDMWEKVQKASAKNLEILEEAFNALDEEQENDELFRSQYREQWTRPESHVFTTELVNQGQQHRNTLMSAQKADQIVYSKLEMWAKIIDILALSEEDLEQSVPAHSEDGTLSGREAIEHLKRLLGEMEEHLITRRQLIDRAKKISNADDISPVLLRRAAQLTAKSPIVKIDPAQFEELFADELRKYDDILMQVDRQDERQSQILRELAKTHQEYCSARENGSTTGKRQRALQNLTQAYQKYIEIRNNLQEGLKVKKKRVGQLLDE